MAELKKRWVPCARCGVRIELFHDPDNYERYMWFHSRSDDAPPQLFCAPTAADFAQVPMRAWWEDRAEPPIP